MPVLARGAAFVEPSGGLLAADAGFTRALGLTPGDPAASLRARAAAEPALGALLRGEGPDAAPLAGAGGEPLRLERHAAGTGRLLVLRDAADGERLEHAARSQGLPLLAGGLSHDVNGPLHAMTLQLALLEEKLGTGAEGRLASAHLGVLRDQIGRVDRMVRRFREVAEPAPMVGGIDLGRLAGDVLALLAHDLHRRGVELAVTAPAGAVRTGAPAERVVRLVLGVIQAAAAATPDGGVLSVEVVDAGPAASLAIAHSTGGPPAGLDYYSEVAADAAEAVGGRLERVAGEGRVRVTLALPKDQG